MNLLVLEPDPSFGGGSEAVMLSLARELAGRGHRIVLLHERTGTMVGEYREFTAEFVQAQLPGFALRSPLRTMACVLRIARIARSRRIDVIVSSHLGFIRHAAIIRALFGISSCFHLGLSLVGGPRSLRMALGHAGAGVAPSAHSLRSWKAGGWNPEALHLVRNWVDGSRFAPSVDRERLRRETGMTTDTKHVVFVGRVCEQKGVRVLLRAFAELAAMQPDVHLHLVGPVAPDFVVTQQTILAELAPPIRSRIHATPVTAHPEGFYAAADVVCAPSIGDEAFGLTVLEAMACAVPVVATAIGIVPQLVGELDAHLLAQPGDAHGLADRLAWWLDRPAESAATGARLRERALDAYGAQASVDSYEAIITDLASRGRKR